jgi:hypothetical protein
VRVSKVSPFIVERVGEREGEREREERERGREKERGRDGYLAVYALAAWLGAAGSGAATFSQFFSDGIVRLRFVDCAVTATCEFDGGTKIFRSRRIFILGVSLRLKVVPFRQKKRSLKF